MQIEGNTAMARDTGKRARKKVELPTANALLLEQRRRREERDGPRYRRHRRTADDRVAKATERLARWAASLEKAQAKLPRARSEKVKARLQAGIVRYQRFIARQAAIVAKYKPIAQLANYAIGVVAAASDAKVNPTEEKITTRQMPERVKVASPTVPLAREDVDAVIDTIEWMRKRKQLDSRQFRAAERLRAAWEKVNGSIGGVMDPDKIRGGGTPGSPPIGYLASANDLNTAKLKLYPLDHRVLQLVVCEGQRIDEAAAIIFRMVRATRHQKEEIGRRLRQGLSELARMWFPVRDAMEEGTIVAYHAPDSKALTSSAGVRQIDVSAAHVTNRKVFRKS